jgi:hypothetical protein
MARIDMITFTELLLYAGTTFCQTFTITDTNNIAINLSNYDIFGRMAKSQYSENYIPLTIEIVNYSEGIIKVSVESDITADIFPGRYNFEIVLVDSYGSVTKIISGVIDVIAGISVNNTKYVT